MKAFTVQTKGKGGVSDIPEFELKPDYVKIKTVAVALNPTDWKHIINGASDGAVIGCDVAGIVEEIGDKVTSNVKKGDKLAGVVHGGNGDSQDNGGFAEYTLLKDGLFIKVPDSLSLEEASTLGIGIGTVGQGLYRSLKLPYPTTPTKTPFPVLIYGGSTATGALAIQFAKLSGLTVLTTASPRNFDFLKSLGADEVFDYNNPACAEKIRDYTKNDLHHVLDCISLPATAAICAAALSSNSSPQNHYSALLPVEKFPREDVDARSTIMYTIFNEPYTKWGKHTPAIPEEYEFAKKFWALTNDLFAAGKLKTHATDVRSGGLEAIENGLNDLKNNKVSAKKVVYKL